MSTGTRASVEFGPFTHSILKVNSLELDKVIISV